MANARQRTAGPVLEAGAQHHHGRGSGADCRSAYGDNGGSGGDGEELGGRVEKEGEDGTTCYEGDGREENGEGGSSSSGDREDGASGAAGPKATPGADGAKRRDGSEAASPDDDDGARSDAARHPSHPAGGMVQTPVETLQAEPLEPSAEVASVNVVLDPYLW